ncbi:MAG: glycosyltransferase family 4 protein [Candidatus Eisenbacteria bacterium]|jgi:glycosyltransferase involved in cell wall biosynthesis|nr:glycosyltransferase family 4 protein [Candidatus Eisenbacteria bacterium]
MRVLMVAERLPPAIGGVERHMTGLVPSLASHGITLTLVAPKHDPRLPDEDSLADARVFRMPTRAGRARYPAAWRWWMDHRHLLLDADIIHFHGVYSLLHWTGPSLALSSHRPRFMTYHGYEMRIPVQRRARLYHDMAERLTRGSLCIGHFLVRWLGIHPTVVTYGACTAPELVPAAPEAHSAAFVGRLAPDTGLDIYLRGLGLLRNHHGIDIPLTVCGDGPWRATLEQLARDEGIRATFHGFIPDPGPIIESSTLVLTSGYLSMLETMVRRRPLFTVYHNPVKEDYLKLMPQASELFLTAPDPATFADQALRVIAQGPSAQMLEQAHCFAAAHTWEALAQHYLLLWGA